MVIKNKCYEKNLADIGFQFERYVTGGSMKDTTNITNVEHIHTMQVGINKILFRAEVDAVDTDGSLVEIKASNSRYWGTKIMFQMISSGSSKLCYREKLRGVLTRVTLKNLSEVSPNALKYADINSLQRNIVEGMDDIQLQLKDAKKHRIIFRNGFLKLVPTNDSCTLFPHYNIVKQLLTIQKNFLK